MYDLPASKIWIDEIGYKSLITLQWLRGKRNNVPVSELLQFLFLSTRFSEGEQHIKRIEEEGGYIKVFFKEYKDPIYYPSDMDLYSLKLIAGENYTSTNWHYYENPRTKIEKDDIVCDCGAAVGTFTLAAAKQCKKVYAVEPLPKFVTALKRTFKNMKNVEIVPYAMMEKSGKMKMKFQNFGTFIGEDDGTIDIPVSTIDDYFFHKKKKITFLKADLEGAEMSMLHGAVKTIRAYKPKIAITTYHKKHDPAMIQEFLKKINPRYKFFTKGVEKRFGNPVMLHAW